MLHVEVEVRQGEDQGCIQVLQVGVHSCRELLQVVDHRMDGLGVDGLHTEVLVQDNVGLDDLRVQEGDLQVQDVQDKLQVVEVQLEVLHVEVHHEEDQGQEVLHRVLEEDQSLRHSSYSLFSLTLC